MELRFFKAQIPTYKELAQLTDEQRSNLIKLAHYLISGELKAAFDMRQYCDGALYGHEDLPHAVIPASLRTDCGTVGCAAGHGPYAGIPKRSNETWEGYIERAFGLRYSLACNFIFGYDWASVDNTPVGAGKRILYTLRTELTDIEDMVHNSIPISKDYLVSLYQNYGI